MTSSTHPNRHTLQKLLAESLPECEEAGLSDHLAVCTACRQEYEVLAATNDWWTEASQRLSFGASQPNGNPSAATFDDDDALFSRDFAVDFLEPSNEVQGLGRLGEYEIVEVIGRGGMGIVLKGFQKELHRHVAVKVLLPHLATSGAARRRFAREAQATAAVVHPHVMAIHSVNAAAKLPYLVMPLVDCESLQQRLNRQGPLDVKDVLRIGMQAAQGLAAAHAQGLVHRDVKPANILLETNVDRVLLTDFGLARAVDDATLTRTGIIAGTPQYMSPEQANGDAVDLRSDLFSLGGVLYSMCTARPPFRAETTFGVLRRIRETAPRSIREINPDIPGWLERITLKLLAKEASERFSSADEVAMLLEQCLAHVQQPLSVGVPKEIANWFVDTEVDPGARNPSPRGTLKFSLTVALTSVLLALSTATLCWIAIRPVQRTETIATDAAAPTKFSPPDKELNEPPSDVPDWNSAKLELDQTADLVEALEATLDVDNETVP